MCIIDAYSKWAFVKHMKNITSTSTIKVLREYFSIWGIPAKLITDNGPSLCSEEIESFLKKNGVFHVKTAPYNPASNGAAESLVRTFKMFLKKCSQYTDLEADIYRFLLNYNSSVHCSTGVSPAALHIGRILYTTLDRLLPFAKNKYDKNLENAKRTYYRGGRDKKYKVNDEVMCRNYGYGGKWIPGIITQVLSPMTYMINVGQMGLMKRHINQIIDRIKDKEMLVQFKKIQF